MSKAQLIKETNKNKEVGTSINKEAKGTMEENGIKTRKGEKVGRKAYSQELKDMLKANKAQLSIITSKPVKERVDSFVAFKKGKDKRFTFSEWAEYNILQLIEREGF